MNSSISINPLSGNTSPLISSSNSHMYKIKALWVHAFRRYQCLIDMSHPHTSYRWVFTALLLVVFMFRILYFHGWYVVTYALGIYLLNALLAFLSPKFDPSLSSDIDNEADLSDPGPALPTKADEEFRPFIRRLPEFVFWHSTTKAILISIFCTLFSFLDIPVFWPVLLVYFIVLFALTMKRQVRHMVKYKYIPFDFGKKSYGSGVGASAFNFPSPISSSPTFGVSNFQQQQSKQPHLQPIKTYTK